MSTRLDIARSQLEQVESLLKTAPADPTLLSLASELRESIRLTLSLEASRLESSSQLPPSTWTVTSKEDALAHVSSQSLDVPMVPSLNFAAGQRCEVKQPEDKRWQAAVVQRRLPNDTYEVRRLYDDQVFQVRGDAQVRPLATGVLRQDFVRAGVRLQARFSADGKYYPAVVKSASEHGAVVTFEGYGNDEHVALEHLKVEAPPVPTAPVEAGEVETPRHLVVLPTDSEQVRADKLRKQKNLKRRAKEAVSDKIEEVKQAKWQAFQATSKRVKGALTDPAGASQFSSVSDDIHARFGTVAKRS